MTCLRKLPFLKRERQRQRHAQINDQFHWLNEEKNRAARAAHFLVQILTLSAK